MTTAERIAALAARHYRVQVTGPVTAAICNECSLDWPCAIGMLLERLEVARTALAYYERPLNWDGGNRAREVLSQ